MLGLRRLYNRNRSIVWTFIIGLAMIIIILQVLNNMAKKENIVNSSINNLSIINRDNNYSIITEQKIDDKEVIEINNVIDKFFTYCNQKKFEEAYCLISDNCKEELFPTCEIFINNYADSLFNTTKIYEAQAWIKSDAYIYKVTMTEDILSTGKIDSKQIEDYFTIVKENGESKLNVNSYIGKKEINKTGENNNIKITVISKQIYMDYEKYTINVENNTDKAILLDGFRNSKSLYLIDTSNHERVSMLNEKVDIELVVERNFNITEEIKFSKQYSTDIKSSAISFDDIILDYYTYNSLENKSDYVDTLNMKIQL